MWQLGWGRSWRELNFILSTWASASKPWPVWYSFQSLKLKEGKPTQGVFYFSLWDDLTFSPAAAADTVQGTVAWKKESMWLREKQAHILIWNICFLLSFYRKEIEIFPFWLPLQQEQRVPHDTAPSKGLGALSSGRRAETKHSPWLNTELWKLFRSGILNSHYRMEKGSEEDSDHDLPKVPLQSTHSPYAPLWSAQYAAHTLPITIIRVHFAHILYDYYFLLFQGSLYRLHESHN